MIGGSENQNFVCSFEDDMSMIGGSENGIEFAQDENCGVCF